VEETWLWFAGLVQKRIAVLITTIIAVLFVLINAQNAYAQTIITVTPPTVIQGSNFQVSGTGFTPNVNVPNDVIIFESDCGGGPLLVGNLVTNGAGDITPVTFSSSSLAVGTYCVYVADPVLGGEVGSVTVIASAIPEYPYGLLILAVFMVLGYAIIKRRLTKKPN